MNFEISPYNGAFLPEVELPDKEFLTVMGEKGIRKLVGDHYDLIRKSKINFLFPIDDKDFEQAKLNSSDFIIQILGGHPYFNENRGKPMLAQRHIRFRITPEARLVWLECYREVLKKLEMSEHIMESYWKYLNVLSMRMVNTQEAATGFILNVNKS